MLFSPRSGSRGPERIARRCDKDYPPDPLGLVHAGDIPHPRRLANRKPRAGPDAARLPTDHARRLRRRRPSAPRRGRARTGRDAGAARHRPRPVGGRPSAARRRIAARGRPGSRRFRRRRGEPGHAPRRRRPGNRPRRPHRSDRRRRRRQLDGLRQGRQLPADQRRLDDRLQGLRQGDEAHAAVDRGADHGRHRQRGAVFRADRRRENPSQNGVRRPQSRLPRCRTRPGRHRIAAAHGDGRHRDRCGVARPGVLRHHAPQPPVADVRAGGVADARREPRQGAAAAGRPRRPRRHADRRSTSPASLSRTRCSASAMPAPTH